MCPNQLREFGFGQLPYIVFLGCYSVITLSRYSAAFAMAAATALYNKNLLKNKNAEAEITLAAILDPQFLTHPYSALFIEFNR
jgi:hypothetical protein